MATQSSTGRIRRFVSVVLLAVSSFVTQTSLAASPAATWTTGHKKVLIIPIKFTDVAGPSDAPGPGGYLSGWGNVTNGTTPAALNDFFQRQSYRQTSMEFTVLPEINMGVSYTNYNAPYGSSGTPKIALWSEPGSLADDARAQARLAGQAAGNPALYDTDNYDLDIIIAGFIPGQGTLSSGRSFGKGIFGNTTLALAHELCHNFGCQHANGISRASGYSPVTNGTFFTDTYGDVYDLMGWKNTAPIPLPPDRDANPFWKNLMGWLPDSNITNPVTSGTCRIYAFDQPVLEAGKNYALRIVRDPGRTYWFSYRQSITNLEAIWSQNGLEVRIGGESIPATGGHTTLLDMTPGSRGLGTNAYATMYDAPLAIGRTYTDAEANLHITPIQKGGTTPESLDVVVNYGPFPGNVAPTVFISPTNLTLSAGGTQTFTATASDPDGDTLAYYWEFDDPDAPGGNAAGNTNPDSQLSTQGSRAWTRSGEHLVRCTVTDMKGHAITASTVVTITGGTTAHLTISGVVKDENGNPLAGAVMHNYKTSNPNQVKYGATNFAGSSATASDGKYVIYAPPIGAQTNYLSVMYQGYAFTCSVASAAIPVTNASVTNVNFTRVRTSHAISGSIYVAGRSYNPATDSSLTLHVNGQNLNATSGVWSTNVLDGTLLSVTATPGNPASTVSYFAPNPYLVVQNFNLMHLFLKIPGLLPEMGFTSSGMTSDDTVGTVNLPVTMTLPAGYNSWPAPQDLYYAIDPSSTAEYGVDYKMAGGPMSFYAGQVPTPRLIPLKIIPNGVPKSKTVVIKLSPGSSIANLGPITTFTYTISNPFPVVAISQTNNTLNLTWNSTASAHYTIESTPSLNPAAWTSLPPHLNLPGAAGTMTRGLNLGDATNQFYRIKVE